MYSIYTKACFTFIMFIGMTQTEQNEVLKKFDQGDCKILVATSVAQEGIDIRECDYVINYGYLTSDVGRVQSRGKPAIIMIISHIMSRNWCKWLHTVTLLSSTTLRVCN